VTDTLIEKVKKLLALADSPNENEAALAAEKAQELMLRHGISMAQVAARSNDKTIGVDEATTHGKTTPWRRHLAHHVAKSMGGRIVYSSDYGRQQGTVYWFGPSGTVESMIDLYSYLETTLVSVSAIETANRYETWIHGKTYRASFLAGAVARIGARLNKRRREMATESVDNSKALVVIGDAVDNRVGEIFPRLRTTSSQSTINSTAYAAGAQAGSNVSLGDSQIGKGRGALTS